MIFRSRRRRNELADPAVDTTDGTQTTADAGLDESATEDTDVSGEETTGTTTGTGTGTTTEPATSEEIDLDALDAGDWRELGPYDIAEIDADALEDPDADPARIDLGSIVLAAFGEMELRLQLDEASQQIVSAMMIWPDSALEVGAFAAPRSGGLWAEVREELVEAAQSGGGSANLVAGPFGVELRRVLPVQAPDGELGYQPSRMWVAEGPRWMLRGILYGQAALEDGLEPPVAELLEAFRQIVVRRGDDAMAPGDLLPLSLPESFTQAAPTAADSTGEQR
jgi:hypothetical protein